MIRDEELASRFLIVLTVLASLVLGALIGGGPSGIARVFSPSEPAPTPSRTVALRPTRTAISPSTTPRPTSESTTQPTTMPTRTPRPTRTPLPSVSPTPPPSPTAVATVPKEPTVTARDPSLDQRPSLTVIHGGQLSVRSTPDFTSDNVIGTLLPDATVPVIGRSEDGLLVKVDDGTQAGWVTTSDLYVRIDGSLDAVPILTE